MKEGRGKHIFGGYINLNKKKCFLNWYTCTCQKQTTESVVLQIHLSYEPICD